MPDMDRVEFHARDGCCDCDHQRLCRQLAARRSKVVGGLSDKISRRGFRGWTKGLRARYGRNRAQRVHLVRWGSSSDYMRGR